MTDVKRSDFMHWSEMPVLWGDVDRLGHVNNAQYFRYAEEARTRYLEKPFKDIQLNWNETGPVLAEIQCQFIRQLHHPAVVEIGSRTVRIGNSSMQIAQAFFDKATGVLVATTMGRIVWFDFRQQQSMRIPDAMRSSIMQLEVIPPVT